MFLRYTSFLRPRHAFKLTAYNHTEWMSKEQLFLRMEGNTTDAVYENFIRQIGGEQIRDIDKPIAEAVALAEKNKEIAKGYYGIAEKWIMKNSSIVELK